MKSLHGRNNMASKLSEALSEEITAQKDASKETTAHREKLQATFKAQQADQQAARRNGTADRVKAAAADASAAAVTGESKEISDRSTNKGHITLADYIDVKTQGGTAFKAVRQSPDLQVATAAKALLDGTAVSGPPIEKIRDLIKKDSKFAKAFIHDAEHLIPKDQKADVIQPGDPVQTASNMLDSLSERAPAAAAAADNDTDVDLSRKPMVSPAARKQELKDRPRGPDAEDHGHRTELKT